MPIEPLPSQTTLNPQLYLASATQQKQDDILGDIAEVKVSQIRDRSLPPNWLERRSFPEHFLCISASGR